MAADHVDAPSSNRHLLSSRSAGLTTSSRTPWSTCVAGASATLRKYGLDRHWRNARTHTTHDPVAYKYRAIGRFMLSDTLPPINTKI